MLVAHIHGSIREELMTAPIVLRKDWRSALGTVVIDLLRRAAPGLHTRHAEGSLGASECGRGIQHVYSSIWLYRMHTEPQSSYRWTCETRPFWIHIP